VTQRSSGFTLVEVLVALVVVALGLAALMVAVQGAARTSGYLRDKTLAQWIALNRITEVRLTANKNGTTTAPVAAISTLTNSTASSTPSSSSNFSSTNDTGQLQFAGRTWHYDTRYFNTNFPDMKRIVVRVWAGDAKTKSNPITEATSFYGTSLGQPGISNVDWTVGSTAAPQPCAAPGNGAAVGGVAGGGNLMNGGGVNGGGVNGGPGNTNCTPAQGIPAVLPTAPAPVNPGTQQ
jgi:prepilin-type N-terminal cleavage/methylation domain-containing protein